LCLPHARGARIGRARPKSRWYDELKVMRCPYLEQILRKQFGPIRYFAADCHVDRRTHNFYGLRWPQPPCLGDHQACELFVRQRAAEDLRLRRYTD